jgi:hypothetical protein
MTTITIAASDLIAAELEELDACAPRSAKELVQQGWTGDPSTYDIGVFYGDLKAAVVVAERELARDETREHEARIRAHLARLLVD